MGTATKTKAFATLTMDKATLLHAVSAAARATVGAKSPRPVLQNVRIGDGLVTGTDLELRIDVAIAEHCEPFLVPAKRLLLILNASQSDKVTLTAGKTSVVVRCGRGSWTLPTEDPAEYPTWEPDGLRFVCRMPASQFHSAVKATAYATDSESSRYALGAVCVDVERKSGEVHFVGTDGRMLALAKVELGDNQDPDSKQVLVPSHAIKFVGEKAGGNGGVEIETNGSDVRFTLENMTVTSRLTDGRYPGWRDLTEKPKGGSAWLDRQELENAVESAAIVTSEQSKGIHFAWRGDSLVLSGQSSQYGESNVQCAVLQPGSCSGTKLDPKFVIDFLKHLPPDEEPHVEIYITNPMDRVLLKCGPYTGVIMPLAEDA